MKTVVTPKISRLQQRGHCQYHPPVRALLRHQPRERNERLLQLRIKTTRPVEGGLTMYNYALWYNHQTNDVRGRAIARQRRHIRATSSIRVLYNIMVFTVKTRDQGVSRTGVMHMQRRTGLMHMQPARRNKAACRSDGGDQIDSRIIFYST